jgi:hypothetical protein
MVNTMGVKEMIQMGAIAESRGDSTTAMRWKTLANDLIIREQVRDGQSTATRQAENRYVSPPGSGIVEPKLQTPWDSDPEYQDVQRQLSKAQSVEGWADDAETRTKVAALQSSLRIREQGARQDAIDNGTWSVADDNILAANRSLHEKAAAVAAQVKSS